MPVSRHGELAHAGRPVAALRIPQVGPSIGYETPIRLDLNSHRAFTSEQKRSVNWVKPQLVAQVAYRDVTPEGLLRHAAFQHFRTDKMPREIVWPRRATD